MSLPAPRPAVGTAPHPQAVLLVAHLLAVLLSIVGAACAPGDGGAGSEWSGSVDTTASGAVHVLNPAEPVWRPGEGWRVEEELRLGSATEDGPELFASIVALEIGPNGRIYLVDGQAQELRIFSPGGRHLRTVGGEGSGPGEFRGVAALRWSPVRELAVVDPRNGRISLLNADGDFLESRPAPGGFVVFPWEGGFDPRGGFWDYVFTYAPDRDGPRFSLVRFDEDGEARDTLIPPRHPGEPRFFELLTQGGRLRAGIPFSPGLVWRRVPEGGVWAALTGDYTLFRLGPDGDTLRVVRRAHEPLAVRPEDVERAVEELAWFTEQGGRIDRARIPDVMPGLETFFLDDDERLWVLRTSEADDRGRVLDVFDPQGRFLGSVRLPFVLESTPAPLFRGDRIYGVTTDELDVPYLVVARIFR